MRSPVLAFSLFAATVAPTLVAGAPTPIPGGSPHIAREFPVPAAPAPPSVPNLPILGKRATDGGTAGGNAHSGNSNDASGGSVGNVSDSDTTAQGNTAASACIVSLEYTSFTDIIVS